MKKSTTRRQRVVGLLSLLALSCSFGGTAGAAPVSVVTESAGSFFWDVATDGNSAFIAAGNRVMAAPAAGGAASTLYLGSSYAQAGSTNILSITTAGGNLFWGDAQSGPVTDSQILRASAAGGGPITAIYTGAFVGQPIVDITGIDTDGTRLYTSDAFGGTVHSLNFNGSGLVQIGPGRHPGGFGDARLNAITFAAGQLFVAQSTVKTSSSPTQFPASFVPKVQQHDAAVTTGSWIDLSTGAAFFGDGPLGITFGAGSLFVTQAASILEFDLAGTLLQTITDPLFNSLRGLTYDNGDLLVVDNTTAGGRVLRVDLAAAVPEPGTLLLLALAGLMFALARIHVEPQIAHPRKRMAQLVM